MREYFIAFRSRSEAVRFYESMLGYRLPVKLINTPSSAGIGCGLSVKFFAKDMQRSQVVLERGHYSTVAGIFYFSAHGGAVRM